MPVCFGVEAQRKALVLRHVGQIVIVQLKRTAVDGFQEILVERVEEHGQKFQVILAGNLGGLVLEAIIDGGQQQMVLIGDLRQMRINQLESLQGIGHGIAHPVVVGVMGLVVGIGNGKLLDRDAVADRQQLHVIVPMRKATI